MAALGPLLGAGKLAEVYAWDGLALKLYSAAAGKEPAFREAAILARIEALQLPAPAVHGVIEHEGRWGVLMDRADGRPLAEVALGSPDQFAVIIERMAELQKEIHSRPGAGFRKIGDRLAHNIAAAPQLDDALRARLLERLRSAPDIDRLCHGDFHPFNVLGSVEQPVVVDWLDAQEGSPAADICRSYVLLRAFRQDIADATLEAGARLSGISVADILWWLPLVAAARLAENVPEEEHSLLAMAAG